MKSQSIKGTVFIWLYSRYSIVSVIKILKQKILLVLFILDFVLNIGIECGMTTFPFECGRKNGRFCELKLDYLSRNWGRENNPFAINMTTFSFEYYGRKNCRLCELN